MQVQPSLNGEGEEQSELTHKQQALALYNTDPRRYLLTRFLIAHSSRLQDIQK